MSHGGHSSHGFHPFGGRVSRRFAESAVAAQPNLAPDDAYLSYYDVRLTKEDVDCIRDDWLTDNAIAFWEEWLEHDKLTRYPNARITLLRPSMCFMLVQTPDPLTLKDALPPLDHITHVFLPVNDCRSPNLAEGGSHWSLLLVSIRDGVAFHYDSLRPSNYEPARIASEKFSRLCGKTLRFVNLDDAPQQNNGSDCGMYVCLEMQFLLKRLLQGGSGEKFSMSMGQNDVDAPRGRKDMLKLIEGFRKKGQRSQSRSRSPAGFGHHHGHLHASGVSEHKTDPPRVGD